MSTLFALRKERDFDMTEHTPIPVAGYTTQSSENVQFVNENKECEERLLRILDAMQGGPYDGRWVSVARTHFQEGFMALNRAIMQPQRVSLPEDDKATAMHVYIDRIARACHEINRAYCEALGDKSQVAWEDAPDWQKDSARKGVVFHLEHPDASPAASHEEWLAEKLATGWKYGPVKDTVAKTHPCFVPYDDLSEDQRAKDYLFKMTVHLNK